MADDHEVYAKMLGELFSDLPDLKETGNLPRLAHYTSLQVLEKIIHTNEIWLSNPLFMNDFEEVRFGIVEGRAAFSRSASIKASLGSPKRFERFIAELDAVILFFAEKHLLDTYVFCLSEHEEDDTDGILSMWRGYGWLGKGAAIVFDPTKMKTVEESPFVLDKVTYATSLERRAWLDGLADRFASHLAAMNVLDEHIPAATHALFERLKLFSLFTKHDGFAEEREWRLVYLLERDHHRLGDLLHYLNGPRGIEPKMRLRVAPKDGVAADNTSLEQLVERIILGPSLSTPLTLQSAKRMFDILKRPILRDRLVSSQIPYRS